MSNIADWLTVIGFALTVYTVIKSIHQRRRKRPEPNPQVVYVAPKKRRGSPIVRQLEQIQKNVLWHEKILDKPPFNI